MKNLIQIISFIFMLTIFCFTISEAQKSADVFINYERATFKELNFLKDLIGPVPPGFYYVDQHGCFGAVGYQPFCNLIVVLKQELKDPNSPIWEYVQRDKFDTVGESTFRRNDITETTIIGDGNSGGIIFGDGTSVTW